jgi:hypothetical protein
MTNRVDLQSAGARLVLTCRVRLVRLNISTRHELGVFRGVCLRVPKYHTLKSLSQT